jgi:hypothetical protein
MKILCPTTTELTAYGTAEIFRANVFKRFGIPRKVVSDRGTQFVSEFMKELYKSIGIKGAPSTAWHPQTDGQTERVNQEVEHFLRLYINYQQNDWANWLDMAEFCLNDKYHSAIHTTPFFLTHGFHPRKGNEVVRRSKNPASDEYLSKMLQARSNAVEALTKARDDMKRFYDRNKRKSLVYEVGSKVWLDGRNIKTYRPTPKLDHKKLGPFVVLEKIGSSSYRLQLPLSWNRVHPVFNEVLLTPYHPPQYHGQIPPPPPDPIIVDDYPEYDVEEILASRRRGRGIQYLVHWKGYDHNEDTWEPRRNITHADQLLEDFYNANPHAIRQMVSFMKDSPSSEFTLSIQPSS